MSQFLNGSSIVRKNVIYESCDLLLTTGVDLLIQCSGLLSAAFIRNSGMTTGSSSAHRLA